MIDRRIVAAALAPAALLAFACSKTPRDVAPKPVAAPVAVAKAEKADVPITVNVIGAAEPFETVQIKTMVGGEVTRVAFAEGQDVAKGALLFTIDPRQYEAQVAAAEAALARDRAQLAKARADEKRNADLAAKEYITKEQYDQLKTNVAAQEAVVRADEAQLENAKVQLSYCTIRSPLAGRLGQLLVHQGNVVKANDAALVTINQIAPIKVSFSAPEARLPEIRRRNAEGRLVVEAAPQAEPASKAEGKLDFLDNSVDRSTGTILLKDVFPNADGLFWPGQFVNVSLRLYTLEGAVVVPNEAIQTGQQGLFVFVVKSDDTVEQRAVKTGPATDGKTVIAEGVKDGETVVTDGQLRLIPGAPVEIKGAGR